VNRIVRAINDIQGRLDNISLTKQQELEEAMDIDFDEHYAMQEAQAFAHAQGKINAEEAQVIYAALGETYDPGTNGGWCAGTNLATKVAVTQVSKELLAIKIIAAMSA